MIKCGVARQQQRARQSPKREVRVRSVRGANANAVAGKCAEVEECSARGGRQRCRYGTAFHTGACASAERRRRQHTREEKAFS